MGKGVVKKILDKHIVSGEKKSGSEVAVKIDQTLTQDATGTMAYLAFESLGVGKIKTELSVSYVDHNTLQEGFENADDHKYLETIAKRYGLRYSKAGNGICHQVHLERFAVPGKTLLGSDSHTPTAGGVGMIAIGAGGMDIALALAGLPFSIVYPRIIKVNLVGQLRPWVSAKDVILEVLRIKTTKGNVNCMLEYGGDGVKTLSVPERATIANMGAELGVTTSVFPSDEITLKFLKAEGREKDWVKIEADSDAEYDEVINIDLSKLEPLAAAPHSPDNVVKVKALSRIKVDQVCIGSCTNSSFKDLMSVAHILRSRRVHPDISLVIAPGSKQVFEMIAKNGALSILISAGARIVESACGFCIGMGQAPRDNGISVRTNNRNFYGRSGTKSAGVYLVSPEVAAATAVKGYIADPRKLGIKEYKFKMPPKFEINDNMIIYKKGGDKKIEIYRGPNISKPPKFNPPSENYNLKVILKVGDKITTDHIMPAGKYLKLRSNVSKYAEVVFESIDPTFARRAVKEKRGVVVVAGKSYGQGSSREHAALCPAYLGVKAVLAKEIERIHRANLVNYGILPLIFTNEKDYDKIKEGDVIEIRDIRKKLKNIVKKGGAVIWELKAGSKIVKASLPLSGREAAIILAGGRLNYEKKRLKLK